MNSTDNPKETRLRRERLMRYTNPRVRSFEWERDANWLWAAYDMNSFSALPKDMSKEVFATFLKTFLAGHSSCLMVDEDHKYFRDKRGPVAMISVDNYQNGWRIEAQIDYFFWATKRQRLAAAVSFLQMIRYAKEVGVCVVRVQEKDVAFCKHLYKYDVLRACGKLPNASPAGTEHLFYVSGRKVKPLELVKDNRMAA